MYKKKILIKSNFLFYKNCIHIPNKSQYPDLAARMVANGLNTDDLDDDEDYKEEESDELMAMSNVGNRIFGKRLPIRTTDDSRYHSVLCMYITNNCNSNSFFSFIHLYKFFFVYFSPLMVICTHMMDSEVKTHSKFNKQNYYGHK